MVETQITQIAVTPYGNGSATTGKTDLVYTLRLSPKKIADTEVCAYPSLFPLSLCPITCRTVLVNMMRLSPQKRDTDPGIPSALFCQKCWA